MIRIEREAWEEMLEHARQAYPEEACGAMLGLREDSLKRVLRAVPLQNVWPGSRRARYQVDPAELLRVEREARRLGQEVLGIYHSHPDEGAYFSRTDLENACPWYCYVVLSVRGGEFAEAGCWQPDEDLKSCEREPLWFPAAFPEESVCRKS